MNIATPGYPTHLVSTYLSTANKISTIMSVTSTPTSAHVLQPTPTLETIPPEIREIIYSYVVPDERGIYQQYAGHFPTTQQFCLPLHEIRPPALGRVSRMLRYEYLPYYFKSTCFRILLPIEQGVGARTIMEQMALDRNNYDNRDLDPTARKWLDSIMHMPNVRFRHLQYRLVDLMGYVLGASINVAFIPSRRSYKVEYRVDDGRLSTNNIGSSGDSVSSWLTPKYVKGDLKKWRRFWYGEQYVIDALEWLYLGAHQDHEQVLPEMTDELDERMNKLFLLGP